MMEDLMTTDDELAYLEWYYSNPMELEARLQIDAAIENAIFVDRLPYTVIFISPTDHRITAQLDGQWVDM